MEEEGFDEGVRLTCLSPDPQSGLVSKVLIYRFYASYGA